MEKQLLSLIEQSDKILITTHISPDPDAVTSSLLLAQTLQENFPKKVIVVNLEELPEGLEFLEGYDEIQNRSLVEALREFKPGLFIILDANRVNRCTRTDPDVIRAFVQDLSNEIKTVIIDHHEPQERDDTELFIHEDTPATAQIVYSLLFDKLDLKKPTGYADIALLGIISDTSRFLHDNPGHRETFRIVSELLDAGASIEALTNRQSRYSRDQMRVFAELANNIVVEDDFVYTFISELFKDNWIKSAKSPQELKNGAEIFVSTYLRNIDDKLWGFIAYPELMGDEDIYGISFRSASGVKDVSEIARKLGGGGHKPAAGAKVKAKNVEAAIVLAKEAIQG